MRTPVKWRVFQAVNGVQLLVALLMCAYVIYSIVNKPALTGTDIGVDIVLLVIIVSTGVFNVINIILVQQFFPDRDPPRGMKLFYAVFLVLFILSFIMLSTATSISFSTMFKLYHGAYKMRGYRQVLFSFAEITLFLLAMIYISIFSLKLRKHLTANFRIRQADDIEQLGLLTQPQ